MNGMNDFSGATAGARSMMEQYRIGDEDLQRVKEFGELAKAGFDDLVTAWYDWLQGLPEYGDFFSDPHTLQRVQSLQHEYWMQFLEGSVDDEYLASRRVVGEAHARIGLSLNVYFAGMNMFMELFGEFLRTIEMKDTDRFDMEESINKLLHMDVAIVVETYNNLVEETLTAQAKSLMEMSTPVTQIWSGILLLPIVGIIDSKRARDIMNATLAKIGETQARIFILDISGVGVVDTAVANHLIKITRATRLMGCDCTISGVSPSIAQTIVDLGIDVGSIKTTSTMKDALAHAFHRVGMEITQVEG